MDLDSKTMAYRIYVPRLHNIQEIHDVALDKIRFLNINESKTIITNDLLEALYPEFTSNDNDLDFNEVIEVTKNRLLIV